MNPDNIVNGSFAIQSPTTQNLLFYVDPDNNEISANINIRMNDGKLQMRSNNIDHWIGYSPTIDGIQFQGYDGFSFNTVTDIMSMKWGNPGTWAGGGTLTWNSDGSNNVRVLVSSIRNKTKISNIDATIDDIMGLRTVQYEDLCLCECKGCKTYRQNIIDSGQYTCAELRTPNCTNPNSRKCYGLIAEEVEQIGNVSSMVLYEPVDLSVDPRGKQPYSIKYHEISILALKLAQENQKQMQQIQRMQVQIDTLTDLVNKLIKKKDKD